MKLLYIACNPPEEDTLLIEREINELTLRISAIPGDRIQAIFLPYCRVEDLPHQIMHHRPDILHIAAHGNEASLLLANSKGEIVALTADAVAKFMPSDYPPVLIYLNACNSSQIAQRLALVAPVVIGSSTPISNLAARASAGLFYARIAEGATVSQAFDAAKAMGQSLETASDWVLMTQSPGLLDGLKLCERFEIVARFSPMQPKLDREGYYELDVGVTGCPAATRQVVLFTDDSSFNMKAQDDHESQMAYELAMVGRHSVIAGEMWFEELWISQGDFRLFAVAVTPEGRMTTTGSLLCDAIDRYYAKTQFRGERVDRNLALQHLALLRGWDGVAASPPPMNGGDQHPPSGRPAISKSGPTNDGRVSRTTSGQARRGGVTPPRKKSIARKIVVKKR